MDSEQSASEKNDVGVKMNKTHQRKDNQIVVRSEQDSAWKQILDCYFKEFVDYCLPQLSELIDWDKGWVSLDKEFHALTKRTETGKRLLDKLFKVYLKNGQEQWVLTHLEVQRQKEEHFPERMFLYECRIYDTYRQGVIGCAILTDANSAWRPNSYEVSVIPGSSLKAEFLVIKLIDYQGQTAALEASTNPFADIILVQLAAIDLHGKPDEQRKRVKFALTKRWYEKGYHKEKILNLYTFIDWLIGLSKPLEVEYLDDVYALEETTNMAYITSAEQLGMEKGLEQGLEQGLQQGREQGEHEKALAIAKKMLESGMDRHTIKKMTGLSDQDLPHLIEE